MVFIGGSYYCNVNVKFVMSFDCRNFLASLLRSGSGNSSCVLIGRERVDVVTRLKPWF
jgi:hypothetical protein